MKFNKTLSLIAFIFFILVTVIFFVSRPTKKTTLKKLQVELGQKRYKISQLEAQIEELKTKNSNFENLGGNISNKEDSLKSITPKKSKSISIDELIKAGKNYKIVNSKIVTSLGRNLAQYWIYASDAHTSLERAATIAKAAKELIRSQNQVQILLEMIDSKEASGSGFFLGAGVYSPTGLGLITSNPDDDCIWDIKLSDGKLTDLNKSVIREYFKLRSTNVESDFWSDQKKYEYVGKRLGISGEDAEKNFSAANMVSFISTYTDSPDTAVFHMNSNGVITTNTLSK